MSEPADPSPPRGADLRGEPEETWQERWLANIRTIGGAVLLAIFIRVVLFEAFEIEGPSMEPTFENGDRVVVAKYRYGLRLPFTHEASIGWSDPEPGDIVILSSPQRGQNNVDIVKRVIGVPGDTIEVRRMPVRCGNGEWRTRDIVYRNGEALPRETIGQCPDYQEIIGYDAGYCTCELVRETLGEVSYVTSNSFGEGARNAAPANPDEPLEVLGPWELDEGYVFVMGDHRDQSNDSRRPGLGPIPISRLKGKALMVYWSNQGTWDDVRWDRIGIMVE